MSARAWPALGLAALLGCRPEAPRPERYAPPPCPAPLTLTEGACVVPRCPVAFDVRSGRCVSVAVVRDALTATRAYLGAAEAIRCGPEEGALLLDDDGVSCARVPAVAPVTGLAEASSRGDLDGALTALAGARAERLCALLTLFGARDDVSFVARLRAPEQELGRSYVTLDPLPDAPPALARAERALTPLLAPLRGRDGVATTPEARLRVRCVLPLRVPPRHDSGP